MERVTIGKLRDQLSAYLRKVRDGETILVLDRNRVIARLEPVTGTVSDEERLARLEAMGIIKRPKRRGSRDEVLAVLGREMPVPAGSIVQALADEREETL